MNEHDERRMQLAAAYGTARSRESREPLVVIRENTLTSLVRKTWNERFAIVMLALTGVLVWKLMGW